MTAYSMYILVCALSWQQPFAVPMHTVEDSVQQVKKELKYLLKDLKEIDRNIQSAEDAELYKRALNDLDILMGSYYTQNMKIITGNVPELFSIYSQYNGVRDQLTDKIKTLKEEAEKEKRIAELNIKFGRYVREYAEMENLGRRYVEIRNMDSLTFLKNKETTKFTEISYEYQQSKDFIDKNRDLHEKYGMIQTAHDAITNFTVKKHPIGDLIFKITIIAAIVFFAINIIHSKVKMKKALSGNKNKDIPSI